ncbi:MAG: hypothetical protein SFX73_40805 [Kofleriaceae bacterium]|nr:hypothetical protein [Kofleriaceae bacterium]
MFRRLVVLGVLVACGDGIAIPDAPTPDADERQLVTVEVRSARLGSGARVLFQDRESKLLTALKTDPAGNGNAYIPDTPSFVTIQLTDEGNTRLLYTIPNVRPGDHVVFDDGTRVKTTPITLTVPSDEGGVGLYDLRTACGRSSIEADTPTSLQLLNCGASVDMLLFSPEGQYLYRPDVGIFDDRLITLEGTYEQFGVTTVRVNKPAPASFQARVDQVLLDGNRTLYPLSSGFVFFDGTTPFAETTIGSPLWPNARVMTRLKDVSTSFATNQVLEWGPRGEPTEIDLDRGLLRTMLTFPRYHPDTRTVSWLERDQGELADATLVQLRWTDEETFTNVVWRMFVERTNNARVTLPLLPDPRLQPVNAVVDDVTNFAIDGGYERLRALPLLGRWNPFDWNDFLTESSPTGRLVYQSSNTSGPDR